MTSPHSSSRNRLPLIAALEVLHGLRTDEIVVTSMGTAREWPKLSNHPLDLHYVPSTMGQAPVLGLGLALACPGREVIVFNGDGCTLMSPGCLVTIVASGARNLTLVIVDNGIYEVTGGQKTAAAVGRVDFAAFGLAAGFEQVHSFSDLAAWRSEAENVLKSPGPRLIVLRAEPIGADYHLEVPGPIGPRLERFREALDIA